SEPIVGANASPFGDLTKWYGLVMEMKGTPYAGIPIRFVLEFPTDYPNSPPKAFFESYVPYDGGMIYKDQSDRYVVCLNIFGNLSHVHTEWNSQAEGWTPSYTVSTILLSMQALMISDMLSTSPGAIIDMKREAKGF